MENSLQVYSPQQRPDDSGVADKAQTKLCVAITENFDKEKPWCSTSRVPTDLVVQVQDINFCVHKLPLISKSEYLGQLELRPLNSRNSYDIKLDNFPGGAETFEVILKFCYGFTVDLKATNIAPIRCASEFLQMSDDYEQGNLISRTESFLTSKALSSLEDSIAVLKSCESLSPWAENLHIVRRCCDSIASKISRPDSMDVEIGTDEKKWFNDVSVLHIDHFSRIITTIKARGSKPEIVGACIMHYAENQFSSTKVEVQSQREKGCGDVKDELQMSISSGRREQSPATRNKKQKRAIEVLVSILPHQREAVTSKFLLRMLKMALAYSVTPALVSELEKRIGMTLENANVDDLLIPSYNNGTEGKATSSGSPTKESTMHDIDIVQRIVEYFLMHEQEQKQQEMCGKSNVGKLLDGYLAEIARDPHLSVCKFQALGEVLPQNARTCHDGLYRAIDIYLKTHPTLLEQERRRLCKVMDWDKLSLDACMHAAQNDRLPLRTVMQVTSGYKVLFSEKLKMRSATVGNETIPLEMISEQDNSWSTKREIKTVILELDKVRTTMAELQHDYSELQQELEKINKQKALHGWISGWRKLKNTALFNRKMNGLDTDGGQAGQTPVSSKNGRRRRQSYS